jgi:uncharacterized protein
MSSSRPLTVVAALALGLTACREPLPSAERSWREEREKAVRAELPAERQASFHGLRFYRYDRGFRLRTMIEPLVPAEALRIAASNGVMRPAHRVGHVRLALPAGTVTLTLFRLDDLAAENATLLFLPFRDAAAGQETYGAGRYVEVERLAGGVVEIDFNRAYNPDCAYGLTAACPITPAENSLNVAIPVGEMLPFGEEAH